jgi:hypothetical protein
LEQHVWWHLAGASLLQARDTEPATEGENTTLQIPDDPPEMLQEGSDRELGHQSFCETSLLSRMEVTQWIRIQRLSPKIKGGLLIYHLEQVTEMGSTACPIMVMYYFIGHF